MDVSSFPKPGAGVGYRLGADLMDGAILFGMLLVPGIVALVTDGVDGLDNGDASPIVTIVSLLTWVLMGSYLIALPVLTGTTPGKAILGLHIQRVDGSRISWGQSIVRTILLTVDLFPFFFPYLLGAILIWTSPTRQRLGDRAAGTMVVRKDATPAITGYETQRF